MEAENAAAGKIAPNKEAAVNEALTNALVALNRNRFKTYYAETKEEALALALELIPEGARAAVGGSVTLGEIGLLDELRSGKYDFIDRDVFSNQAERAAKIRESLQADVFFMSSNAVTEDGLLYNVDGSGGRVAALQYGPKSVIVIAGRNKIVPALQDAVLRVKTVAAPLNTKRLGCRTYCAEKGRCLSVDQGCGEQMTAGCASRTRICSKYSVEGMQYIPGRIKVILVDEDLGF